MAHHWTVSTGDGPDVLAFDPGWQRIYVAAESGVVTVVAEQGRSIRSLGRGFVAPAAHSIAVDPITHQVYLPLEDRGGHPHLQVAVFAPEVSR